MLKSNAEALALSIQSAGVERSHPPSTSQHSGLQGKISTSLRVSQSQMENAGWMFPTIKEEGLGQVSLTVPPRG